MCGVAHSELKSEGNFVNILLVEDNTLILESTAEMMRGMGHTVFEATNADSGMAILRQSAIDVLVTDVGLPAKSGDVFAAEARMVCPAIGIVFATGLNSIHNPGSSDAGTVLLRKPYDASSIEVALAAARP
jgi:CheY-like chemotaxis protein